MEFEILQWREAHLSDFQDENDLYDEKKHIILCSENLFSFWNNTICLERFFHITINKADI